MEISQAPQTLTTQSCGSPIQRGRIVTRSPGWAGGDWAGRRIRQSAFAIAAVAALSWDVTETTPSIPRHARR